MTKSAQMFRQLEENERHNQATEALQKKANTIALVTGLASAVAKPLSAAIGRDPGDYTSQLKKLDTPKNKELYEELLARKTKGERLPQSDFSMFKKLSKLFGGKE